MSLFTTTNLSVYRGGLLVTGSSYEIFLNEATLVASDSTVTTLGSLPGSRLVSIARNQFGTTPDVVAVDPDNGAYVLFATPVVAAQAEALFAGSGTATGQLVFTNDDPDVTLTGWPVTISSGSVASADAMALAFVAAINANTTLQATNTTATHPSTGKIQISQLGSVGNNTFLAFSMTAGSGYTCTFTPTTGLLQGGEGIEGIWNGTSPTSYNAQGILPVINSVAFQDSYFFFTSGNNQCYASNNNSLVVNALNFITCEAKSDVQLLRAIAYAGVLYLFTTGSCEIWQDAANPPPAFPYNRQVVLETGLLQSGAIAGWETGFAQLCWVSQDFGVYWNAPTQLAPTKISPPDLDRAIEAQFRAGADLQAGCYIFAGKKFWHLSSPAWTWEFNLSTQKWNERSSLNAGQYGRWRGVSGHPAFGKWIVGDEYSGNLLWIDNSRYDENGAVQLFRLESGPARQFPEMVRIARADFDFDMGVGLTVGNYPMTVTGTAAGNGGVVRLTLTDAAQAKTNDTVTVSGVGGTTEANGTWQITAIDVKHIELIGSTYVNTYTSGGIALDITATPNMVNPQVAISCSNDGGNRWGNPLLRSLGRQGHVQRVRASVKNMGLSGPQGTRWRLDVTDPVYVGLMGGLQSSNPRFVGA
jgi:hypothetical protein